MPVAMRRLLVSPSSRERLAAALELAAGLAPATEALVLAPAREAADDFARALTARRGATFGLHRFSLTQLAAHLAAAEMARLGLAPATPLALEAIAARAVAEVGARGAAGYFAPVAPLPGFARALAATHAELRAVRAELPPAPEPAVAPAPLRDLRVLVDECDRQIEAAAVADRARLFALASEALRRAPRRFAGWPLLLLDLPLEPGEELGLVEALLARCGPALATVPAGDQRTLAALERAVAASTSVAGDGGLAREAVGFEPVISSEDGQAAAGAGSLARLRRFLFSPEAPPPCEVDDGVRVFSAPGEARECVEIARRVLDEARAGVPFDRIAVFLRAPQPYAALLEAAFRRAGVPAWFARGTTRPDAAGRAFLALLRCREEGLSASRFAEYLSLAQVPLASPAEEAEAPRADDEALAALSPTPAAPAPEEGEGDDEPSEAAPRAPWKWEDLLVDAAVIGGRDRWQRRLLGLEESLARKREALLAEEPDSPRLAAIERDQRNARHLRAFALPLIERLDALPVSAPWGEWLPPLAQLAGLALRRPERVLRVLAELAPMTAVGPVSVDEVARVLGDRLSLLEQEPPAERHGRVFVGPTALARARSFEVVFVPGLAERIFPQRPREDPLLLDAWRRRVSADLRTQLERGLEERRHLALPVGAAERRIHLSYPRVDVVEARARVTSFYGLEVARATRGAIPDVEAFARAAENEGGARLAWPAPADPARAVDRVEHDLAVLGRIMPEAGKPGAKGRARYLLELNPWLSQALRSRYARWQMPKWRPEDGLIHAGEEVRALLSRYRLGERPYSPSALQRFAVCPYQFLLAAIHRFEPREEPAPLEQLDPLERGSLFHQVQAETLRALKQRGALPLAPADLEAADAELQAALDAVAAEVRERVAPPIERVWQDEIAALRTDLRIWLRHMAAAGDRWRPLWFEYGFGLPPDAGRDPASRREDVVLPGGARLRGSIDLVEQAHDGEAFRVTDHKTGRDSTPPMLVVGGGEVLQPVLYALAVEAATGREVLESRLWYCTTRGGFAERVVPMNHTARERAATVLAVVDRAIELGNFPPAPREQACRWCEFRAVCGPYEEERARRKDGHELADLSHLRGLP